jgi:hypothetical protein
MMPRTGDIRSFGRLQWAPPFCLPFEHVDATSRPAGKNQIRSAVLCGAPKSCHYRATSSTRSTAFTQQATLETHAAQ